VPGVDADDRRVEIEVVVSATDEPLEMARGGLTRLAAGRGLDLVAAVPSRSTGGCCQAQQGKQESDEASESQRCFRSGGSLSESRLCDPRSLLTI
jgi:hypothetical protein